LEFSPKVPAVLRASLTGKMEVVSIVMTKGGEGINIDRTNYNISKLKGRQSGRRLRAGGKSLSLMNLSHREVELKKLMSPGQAATLRGCRRQRRIWQRGDQHRAALPENKGSCVAPAAAGKSVIKAVG